LDITKIIAVGIATALSCIILKQSKPEIAVVVGLVGTIVILVMVIGGLQTVIDRINGIVAQTGIKTEIFASILKIVGIGYLCEFASGICRDAGSSSVADVILLGGKILILVVAIPIIEGLVSIVLEVIP
jgi:stage III sporulation protein AD